MNSYPLEKHHREMNMVFAPLFPLFRIAIGLIVFAIVCLIPLTASCEDIRIMDEGDDYYVLAKDNRGLGEILLIMDLEHSSVVQKTLDFHIDKAEICKSRPFISVIGHSYGYGNIVEKSRVVYDVANDKLYEIADSLGETEQRWSEDGEHTYINKGTSFSIIETNNLIEYLESPSDYDESLTVQGHPLGEISQYKWLEEYLIYETGCCESTCWGTLNIKTKTNYFICCIGAGPQTYSSSCQRISRRGENFIEATFINLLENDELKKVSLDFYNSVSDILRQNRLTNEK